jgi:hypothetical protein
LCRRAGRKEPAVGSPSILVTVVVTSSATDTITDFFLFAVTLVFTDSSFFLSAVTAILTLIGTPAFLAAILTIVGPRVDGQGGTGNHENRQYQWNFLEHFNAPRP